MAAYYISRKQQLATIIRYALFTAILLDIAMYMFVRLSFQDFDISLTEDSMNGIRAVGLATLFVCILFSPCMLLEALVYFSRIADNEALAEDEETKVDIYTAV